MEKVGNKSKSEKTEPTDKQRPRMLSVASAAAELFKGDESQVWAGIVNGSVQATILVEASDGQKFEESVTTTWARKFMAGDEACSQDRSLQVPPEVNGNEIWIYSDFHDVKCIARRATVVVELAQNSPLIGAGWPWGSHETELLKKLKDAAIKFWKNYDPSDTSTAPTNRVVSAWLIEQGVSQRVAAQIAQILRADGLPSGPRK